MTEQTLLNKRYDEHIVVLTFNRPQSLNALDFSTMRLFADAIDDIAQDSTVRVLILTGAGERAFSSGGDIHDLADKHTEADALEFITIMGDTLLKMEHLPIPIIAAINGYALGGGSEIALACDMRIVDEKTQMGLVQLRLGLTPGWGGGQRLLRLVGYSRAMHLILDAHVMRAPQLKELGLAMQIVDAGTAFDHALTFARQIAKRSPETVRGVKQSLQAGLNHPYEEALAIAREIFPPLWAGDAHVDASEQFLNRQSENKTSRDNE